MKLRELLWWDAGYGSYILAHDIAHNEDHLTIQQEVEDNMVDITKKRKLAIEILTQELNTNEILGVYTGQPLGLNYPSWYILVHP